jgi:hypothetical protein
MAPLQDCFLTRGQMAAPMATCQTTRTGALASWVACPRWTLVIGHPVPRARWPRSQSFRRADRGRCHDCNREKNYAHTGTPYASAQTRHPLPRLPRPSQSARPRCFVRGFLSQAPDESPVNETILRRRGRFVFSLPSHETGLDSDDSTLPLPAIFVARRFRSPKPGSGGSGGTCPRCAVLADCAGFLLPPKRRAPARGGGPPVS